MKLHKRRIVLVSQMMIMINVSMVCIHTQTPKTMIYFLSNMYIAKSLADNWLMKHLNIKEFKNVLIIVIKT